MPRGWRAGAVVNQVLAVVALTEGQSTQRYQIPLDQMVLEGERLKLSMKTRQQVAQQSPALTSQQSQPITPETLLIVAVIDDANADAQKADKPEATATQAAAGQQQAAANDQGRPVRVDWLLDVSLYNVRGQLLGDIERVVRNTKNEVSVIIGRGGFLGLGEKQISVPVSNTYVSGDRLVVRGLTDAQLSAMPEWTERAGIADVEENQTVVVGKNI